jgi:hypothetical protein
MPNVSRNLTSTGFLLILYWGERGCSKICTFGVFDNLVKHSDHIALTFLAHFGVGCIRVLNL